ncbi:hypothetical protein B0T26DRAFT_747245 [Lasiosphaeria miniovina]|uniref:Uncharacterized protein n=1 Tax=Lasiosphaeria miniovina TaxID=1954250 RepID=A0AA40B3E9_9PEZI|nr:uncharacterized protein B0T26DRAFT_747245 [Lasiosphaeria miniovina]KAK0726855.1 hypothetical protein B0T26DRAFT_747245 [Lasiosphaeria miniovina]
MATMFKFRGLLDDLIHLLKSQRLFFYMNILQLLQEARVAGMIGEVDQTEEVCIRIIRDTRTGHEIHDYLGHLYTPFLQILERYEICLKRIAATLGHLRPANSPDIIQANSDLNMTLSIKGRLEFTIKHKHLLAILDELRTERLFLKTIIKGMKTQRLFETRHPFYASRALSNIFEDVHTSAQRAKNDVIFNRFLFVDNGVFQETTIDATANGWPTGNDSELFLAPTTTDIDSGLPQGRIAQDEDVRMTPKQQALLALDVASSVLQLQQTLWCSIPWNSTAIKFFLQKERDCSSPDLDVKETLLELAILLLEIWHHVPLEAWAQRKGLEVGSSLE